MSRAGTRDAGWVDGFFVLTGFGVAFGLRVTVGDGPGSGVAAAADNANGDPCRVDHTDEPNGVGVDSESPAAGGFVGGAANPIRMKAEEKADECPASIGRESAVCALSKSSSTSCALAAA